MRSISSLAKSRAIIAVFIVMFGFTTSSKAESLVPIAAKALRIGGEVKYSIDGVSWHPLKAGESIKPGYTIQTAERSSVEIAFGHSSPSRLPGQNTLIYLFPDSSLEFEKLDIRGRRILRFFFWGKQTKEIGLNLKTGRVLGTVQKEPPIADYEVRFANYIVRIPFGNYVLESPGKIFAVTGSALVSDNSGVVVREVKALQVFDSVTGTIGQMTDLNYALVFSSCNFESPIRPTFHRGPGLGGALRGF